MATIRAQLKDAEWRLSETVVACRRRLSVNLQLAGLYAASLPISPVMSFVEDVGVIVATYKQNALHKVQPGDHAE